MKRTLENRFRLSYLFTLSEISTRKLNPWIQNQVSKLDKSSEREHVEHAYNGKAIYSLE